MSPFQAPQYSNVIEFGVKPPGLAASSLISGSVGRQFSVRVEQPAAEWVAAALDRIEELTGRSLSAPKDLAELCLAFEVEQRLP